jgi:alpha-beta hydrolase superfamily lysophospholipase
MEEKIFVKTSDGVKICVIWTPAKEKSEKAVVLAHGITVTKEEDGMFTDLAKLLSENGFGVVRFDFRGHGESEGKQEDMTIAGELSDMDAIVGEAQKKGYKKIGLVGASFGGGISTLFTSRNPGTIAALCLWNPCLNYEHIFIKPITPWLSGESERIQKGLEANGYAEIGSRNYKMGKKLFDQMKGIFPYQELENIGIPVQFIHGLKDRYVPFSDSKDAFETYNGTKSFIDLPEADHGLDNNPEVKSKTFEDTLKFFQTYL